MKGRTDFLSRIERAAVLTSASGLSAWTQVCHAHGGSDQACVTAAHCQKGRKENGIERTPSYVFARANLRT